MHAVKIWQRWLLSALLVIGCLALLGSLWYIRTPSAGYQVSDGISTTIPPRADGPTKYRGPVTMVAVTCADGLELTMTSLKSAAAFSRAPLKLILYADVENIKLLQDRIMQWPESVLARITYDLRLVMFPKKDFDKWKHFFAPCSSQRLFLPDMLLNEDAVLYVDADTLFLGPVEDLWDVFDKMNKSQMVALSYEAEDPTTNWYQQHAKHPYVPPFGVNAGVMPMNLTRMREFDWVSHMEALLKEYEGRIPWVDQDLVNILFSAHPDKLFLMTCRWNYRQDNCQFHSSCLGQTPALLHANRRCFLVPDRAPAYTAFHPVMRKYELGTSLERNFIDPLERELHRVRRNECVVQFLLHSKQWRTLARQLDDERGYNDDSSDEMTS
ncbi:glucoside xylosyltransferase 1-like [Ixodes scapularis]|uniref:glucoside xylosyltransferase 1-like n=1 Tax=Ixodes scapularis TaxID=6945 RepID=UPI001C3916AE|nr:glucoside xylosyltransferase 1-like [Ixodes scapularis]